MLPQYEAGALDTGLQGEEVRACWFYPKCGYQYQKLTEESRQPNPFDLLFSSDSEGDEDVKQIRVTVEGSQSRFACVIVEGVPADSVVDKVPRTYDRKAFRLECMDMDLSFANRTMKTTVYIKMDSYGQLLDPNTRCLQTARKTTAAVVPTISQSCTDALSAT